jgi:hypothetical protein
MRKGDAQEGGKQGEASKAKQERKDGRKRPKKKKAKIGTHSIQRCSLQRVEVAGKERVR